VQATAPPPAQSRHRPASRRSLLVDPRPRLRPPVGVVAAARPARLDRGEDPRAGFVPADHRVSVPPSLVDSRKWTRRRPSPRSSARTAAASTGGCHDTPTAARCAGSQRREGRAMPSHPQARLSNRRRRSAHGNSLQGSSGARGGLLMSLPSMESSPTPERIRGPGTVDAERPPHGAVVGADAARDAQASQVGQLDQRASSSDGMEEAHRGGAINHSPAPTREVKLSHRDEPPAEADARGGLERAAWRLGEAVGARPRARARTRLRARGGTCRTSSR
jgi:hypothetical protein